MENLAAYGFVLALSLGLVLVIIQITTIFFKNKEKIALQKETNELLKKLLEK